MEDKPRYAGHRLIQFSPQTRRTLSDIARRLLPHAQTILDKWISQQFESWQPPSFTRESLSKVFGSLLDGMLQYMLSGELEACVDSLEQAGASLAGQQFPFDALVISVHFLEESYMPLMLNPPPPEPRKWLVTMDEFLHVALAAIANAYFEAYRKELLDRAEVGRIVQEGLLPNIPRKIADLDVGYTYISAHEQARLGGDFLDAFEMETGEFAFVIGDLSGHGLEAAADSIKLRSIFRGFMREEPDLARAMGRLNVVLASELSSGHFATALAIAYGNDGRIRLVNAGHPLPILCNSECQLLENHGCALAIGIPFEYTVTEHKLEPGGLFVAYTDGVTEARNGGELFGEDRIISIVRSMQDAPARAIVDQLIDDALRHAGGKLPDDTAIVVLKRESPAG